MGHPLYPGVLQRLARLCKLIFVRQNSRFLEIPLDILYAIIERLPLQSAILLSQACRVLWYQFGDRCFSILQRCTAEQRLDTLTALGSLLPDHYLCVICNALHCIDYDDHPASETQSITRSARPCSSVENWDNTHHVALHASSFRHIQLAIKYTHMKFSHQAYRQRLLQKFEYTYSASDFLTCKCIGEPRIVGGRYILMTSCVFSTRSMPCWYELISELTISFCPHSAIGPLSDLAEHPFNAVVRQAFRCPSNPRPEFFSCDRCPTDMTILVKENEACIVCWSDLGRGESSQDSSWQSQLWTLENSQHEESPFRYCHGSIRELYTTFIACEA